MVLLEQHGAHEADDRRRVGNDADRLRQRCQAAPRGVNYFCRQI